MSIKSKIGIGTLALAILLIGVVLVSSASSNNSQETPSKDGIQGMTDLNDVKIPDFGPYVFDDLKQKPNFLSIKG